MIPMLNRSVKSALWRILEAQKTAPPYRKDRRGRFTRRVGNLRDLFGFARPTHVFLQRLDLSA
jgi:hypothetical protein